MLNKISERVLRCIIDKCGGDPMRDVILSHKDFIHPSISNALLISICEHLKEKGYLTSATYHYQGEEHLKLTLSYSGYAYFEYKHLLKREYIKSLFVSSVFSILVSIVTAILTTILISQ